MGGAYGTPCSGELQFWSVMQSQMREQSKHLARIANALEAGHAREEVVAKTETTTAEAAERESARPLIGNAAKKRDTGDWLSQLVGLINGEINRYMSQGADHFSVDCGPWHIKYDNTEGRDQ